jgi:hypothetical protein
MIEMFHPKKTFSTTSTSTKMATLPNQDRFKKGSFGLSGPRL